jgi:outer membrane protein
MKISKLILPVMAIALMSSLPSFAQKTIAHINTQELIEAMPEMQSARAEIEKLAKSYENDIQTMATELQNKVKQYDSEAQSKTEEENRKRIEEVQGMEQSIRQFQGQAQQDIAQKENELLEPILKKAKDAVVKVAKALGYTYVLDTTPGSGVILADGKDLMTDVKKELGF